MRRACGSYRAVARTRRTWDRRGEEGCCKDGDVRVHAVNRGDGGQMLHA